MSKVEYYRKRIEIAQRNLQHANNCDWAGQVIYCKLLLEKYENKLMSIILRAT